MPNGNIELLRNIKTLPSLIRYLRDELDWPIESDDVEDLTFDYEPEELGLDAQHAAKVREIKQLRPLDTNQPWGIFWLSFEKKRLPMVVLRRVLGNLVVKRRASGRRADQPAWHLHDLLFISSYGEEEHRTVSFAHFAEDPHTDELPVLRVLGWDDQNSIMHLDRVANRLHSNLRWPGDEDDVEAWRRTWSEAFTDRYREAIRSADELIPRLADLAANIRRRVRDVLDAETERGPMRRLMVAVQKLLIHDLNEDGFADMYAQTVAYGLLSARFSRPAGLTAQNLVQLTAVSNPFLENLLENLFRLNRGKFHFDVDEVGINDVLDLLRNTNIEAIKAAFSDRNPTEDPVIRFYEGFLKLYDRRQRIKRGVFFTPRPVVSYIVRSVHELLQKEFGLEDGLADTATWADMAKKHPGLEIPKGAKPDDPFVCILDPATGTGTFLFECIEVIERTMKNKWSRELGGRNWSDPKITRRWQEYVPRHLLTRLYGYELMMAPYSIAHVKLALKLGETGYQFQEGDRLHIYITNSLEAPSKLADARLSDMFTALAKEAQEVNSIKGGKRFTVVVGNPPYSNLSANLTEEARALVKPYKFLDGERIRERGALSLEKNLNDDYVKFIRFSETLVTIGVSALVTNNGFIANPTLRGMRWSLLKSFDRLYVLNLLGYAGASTRIPEGVKDENIFDIANAGVAVHIGVRTPHEQPHVVRYSECCGSRADKYAHLAHQSVGTLAWTQVTPRRPYFCLEPITSDVAEEYESGIALLALFKANSTGIRTLRDDFVVDFEPEPILRRVGDFASSGETDAVLCSRLGLSTPKWWHISESRRALRGIQDFSSYIRRFSYRPFDVRCLFYHDSLVGSPRRPVMQHMEPRAENLGLHVCRQLSSSKWQHVFVTRGLTDDCYVSNRTKERGYTIPLYIRQMGGSLGTLAMEPNCDTTIFRRVFAGNDREVTPEGILHYAYAVMFSPTYRVRCLDSLKRDFPHIPLPGSLELFQKLSALGADLAALHLLEDDYPSASWNKDCMPDRSPLRAIQTNLHSDGTVMVERGYPIYEDGRILMNSHSWLECITREAWGFCVGGYQVCEKWLKDRKGRELSAEDIVHYQKIVAALAETIHLMGEIDKVIEEHGGWPGAFTVDAAHSG